MSLEQLRNFFPYPAERPDVPASDHGWLLAPTAEALKAYLSVDTKVVVELGSWVGLSTRHICECAPNAAVIAVDHWCGSAEHHYHAGCRVMLSYLYETFLSSCWAYRERLLPLRMGTIAGLQTVSQLGVYPDLIYIDAAHDEKSIAEDVSTARRLFPNAVLIGDDWQMYSVRMGVYRAIGTYEPPLYSNDAAWWYEPEVVR